ncbi:hypothetical protein H8957_009150 [Semnopithecus entellus]
MWNESPQQAKACDFFQWGGGPLGQVHGELQGRLLGTQERAPKATCRRPAPGRAPSACGNRPLHPARDAELRENLVQRGLNARAPPRGRFLSRPHPPGDHRAASPAARRQK